jgi:hypothetical protein
MNFNILIIIVVIVGVLILYLTSKRSSKKEHFAVSTNPPVSATVQLPSVAGNLYTIEFLNAFNLTNSGNIIGPMNGSGVFTSNLIGGYTAVFGFKDLGPTTFVPPNPPGASGVSYPNVYNIYDITDPNDYFPLQSGVKLVWSATGEITRLSNADPSALVVQVVAVQSGTDYYLYDLNKGGYLSLVSDSYYASVLAVSPVPMPFSFVPFVTQIPQPGWGKTPGLFGFFPVSFGEGCIKPDHFALAVLPEGFNGSVPPPGGTSSTPNPGYSLTITDTSLDPSGYYFIEAALTASGSTVLSGYLVTNSADTQPIQPGYVYDTSCNQGVSMATLVCITTTTPPTGLNVAKSCTKGGPLDFPLWKFDLVLGKSGWLMQISNIVTQRENQSASTPDALITSVGALMSYETVCAPFNGNLCTTCSTEVTTNPSVPCGPTITPYQSMTYLTAGFPTDECTNPKGPDPFQNVYFSI